MKVNDQELDEWYSSEKYASLSIKDSEQVGIIILQNTIDKTKYAVSFWFQLKFLATLFDNKYNGFYTTLIANDIKEVQNKVNKFLIKMEKLKAFR